MKNFSLLVLMTFVVIGCHSQVPPSPAPIANVNWTAPVACTTAAPCVYVVSRAVVTSSACPTTTGTAYTQIGTTANNVLTFTDSTATSGTSACWIIQAQQGTNPTLTSQPSAPSNNGTALTIPVVPGAPGAPNATATASLAPPLLTDPGLQPLVASNDGPPTPLKVTARLVH